MRSTGASNAVVTGIVRDSAGQPLGGADVRLMGAPARDYVADAAGRYRVARLAAGEHRLMFRRVGYRPELIDILLNTGERIAVDVELERAVTELPVVNVRGPRSRVPAQYQFTHRYDDFFLNRATAVNGGFFDRAKLDRFGGPTRALRTLPGVQTSEFLGKMTVSFNRCPRGQRPVVMLNGVLHGPDVLLFVDVNEIELIEVYRSVSERPNWAAGNSCGAIAIYTR